MIELPLNPRNPGEVLAACGLFNLAAQRGTATAWFADNSRFLLDTPMALADLLALLSPAQSAVAEDLSWVRIAKITLNWWMREGKAMKLWAGQVNPQNLTHALLEACAQLHKQADQENLLSLSVPLTKRFGADPRSAWVSLDIGFSPNDQGTGDVHTRPFTELLAMVGLQTFLPRECGSRQFAYRLWQTRMPLLLARLAFQGINMPFPTQHYRFTVKKTGSFSIFDFAEWEE